MSMKLVQAGPEDAGFMARVLGDWVAQTDWMPKLHSRAEDVAFCEQLAPRTLIARNAEGPLGFLARREDEILCLYVDGPARGQGVGAALIAEAQRARRSLALWSFAANTAARRFYAGHGFVETGGTQGDNDENLPDIRLEWSRP